MIVVTGGAGFIGSNLVAALADRNEHELVVCDDFGTGDKWRNISKHEIAEFVSPANLLEFLDSQRKRIRAIFHLGAISSTTETDVDLIVETNFRLSMDIWKWCASAGSRLIYASSAATYGNGDQGFDDDDSLVHLAKLRPLNAYGWSKHAFDRRLSRLRELDVRPPAQCVGLKFFNVYGPNEYHKGSMMSIVAKLHSSAAAGHIVQLFKSHDPQYPDGGQLRDFVYVRDCVGVMLWLLDNPGVNGLFNIGTGRACSFSQFIEALFRAVNREARIEYIDMPESMREKYQYYTQASLKRLRAAGYVSPFTSVEQGVADYVNRFLSQPDPFR